MGRQYRIAKLLSTEDRETFRAMALEEGIVTIEGLHKWLLDRGYKVSHGAVYNYARHCRRGGLGLMQRQFGGQSDAQLRKKLAAWARQLTGTELASVAFLAAFHAEARTRRAGQTKGGQSVRADTEASCD
jgi:hypothetical protein